MAIFKGVYKDSIIFKGGKNVERCANFEAKCAPVKHIRICVLKGDLKKHVKWLYSGVQECAQTSRISHLLTKKYNAAKQMIGDQMCFDNMKRTPKRNIFVFSKNLQLFYKETC